MLKKENGGKHTAVNYGIKQIYTPLTMIIDSDDVVWIKIGRESDSFYIDKVIYICGYLENELTSSDQELKFNFPLESMMRGKMLMIKECGFIENIRNAIIYNCYNENADYKIIVGATHSAKNCCYVSHGRLEDISVRNGKSKIKISQAIFNFKMGVAA